MASSGAAGGDEVLELFSDAHEDVGARERVGEEVGDGDLRRRVENFQANEGMERWWAARVDCHKYLADQVEEVRSEEEEDVETTSFGEDEECKAIWADPDRHRAVFNHLLRIHDEAVDCHEYLTDQVEEVRSEEEDVETGSFAEHEDDEAIWADPDRHRAVYDLLLRIHDEAAQILHRGSANSIDCILASIRNILDDARSAIRIMSCGRHRDDAVVRRGHGVQQAASPPSAPPTAPSSSRPSQSSSRPSYTCSSSTRIGLARL